MREVAPKAIPRQKVQENEESVWDEMRVLQGLHHLNMVSLISPPRLFSMIRLRTRPCLSPNMFDCLSAGQILRLVKVWDKYDLDLKLAVDGGLFEHLNQHGHLSERDAIAVLRYVEYSSLGDNNERLMPFILSLVPSCPA